jgi:hypothetical protein
MQGIAQFDAIFRIPEGHFSIALAFSATPAAFRATEHLTHAGRIP